MRLIKQESEMGCGVACVASVLGLSYQSSLKLFKYGKLKANSSGFMCKEIVKALGKGGLKYEYKYIKLRIRNKIYREGTIVFLIKSKRYSFNHYLLRCSGGWMDPWVNFPDKKRRAGFRKKLPGKPIYVILRNEIVKGV